MPSPPQISDLRQDPDNANQGTERGNQLLRKSIEDCGLGRGIVVDKNNTIIAGNKTQAAAIAAGKTRTKIVKTTGDTLIVVKRTDLDLTRDTNARKLALLDNRTAQLGLKFDPAVVRRQAETFGFNAESAGFTDAELQLMEMAAAQATAPEPSVGAEDNGEVRCPHCGLTFRPDDPAPSGASPA